jgi:hypothetical protein
MMCKKRSVLARYSKDQGFFGHRREVLTASPESPCVRRYDAEKAAPGPDHPIG